MYIETHSIRTEAPANYDVQPGGELVFPVLTVLTGKRSPALSVAGHIQGVEELRVFKNVHSTLRERGSSSCFFCEEDPARYSSHYWFGKVKVMLGGVLEVESSSHDVAVKTVALHVSRLDLDYTGSLQSDTVEVFSRYSSIEFDATLDATGRGWPSGQGPGSRSTCELVAGAGHGRPGGSGKITGCSTCQTPGKEKLYAPLQNSPLLCKLYPAVT